MLPRNPYIYPGRKRLILGPLKISNLNAQKELFVGTGAAPQPFTEGCLLRMTAFCHLFRLLRLSLGESGLEQLEILGLPPHGVVDAPATTRVIVENPFFNRAGAHLAVFAEMDGALCSAVGLATGISSRTYRLPVPACVYRC